MPAPLSELFDPLFSEATQILIPNIPVEGGVAFQPDNVRQIGELRADAGEDIVGIRMFDTEMSFTPLAEEEAPSTAEAAVTTVFVAFITSFIPLAPPDHQWTYGWQVGTMLANGRYVRNLVGATHLTLGNDFAHNLAEHLNSSTAVNHGVEVVDTSVPRVWTATVDPIPIGTPVTMFKDPKPGGATFGFSFSEPVPVNFDCD